MNPEGLTCILVALGSGGLAFGWSTENMTRPTQENRTALVQTMNRHTS